MKHTKSNQQGFALVIAIILVALIATLVGSVNNSFVTLAKTSARDQARFDAQNLNFYLRILYKNRTYCRSSLLPGAFGNELRRRLANPAAAKTLDIEIPFPNSTGTLALIRKDLRTESIVIQENSIDHIETLPFSGNPNYLVRMKLSYTPASEPQFAMTAQVPLYVVGDATGNLTDCFLTTFTQDRTAEDVLCENYFGRNYRYRPGDGRCARTGR